MAVDLQNRPNTPDADSNDPAQQHYDDVFNNLTSAEHMAKDGQSGGTGGAAGSEQSFGNPNAAADTNKSHDKATPTSGDLSNKEAAAAGIAGAAAGGLYNAAGDTVNPIARFFSGRKKSVTGGIIGLVLSGTIFMGLGISSGPLQFIHLSQLLQQFHFNEQSDDSDDRLSKLSRFYRYTRTGRVEETRLGIFANSYASSIEAKLNASGIESQYDGFGRFQGYEIDRTNDNFKDKSPEQIQQEFKEEYGADVKLSNITDDSLTIKADASATAYFAQRRVIGGVLEQAGYKGITGAIQARIMSKRIGLSLFPLGRLDTKIKSSAADIINKTRDKLKSDVDNGEPANEARTGTAKDENNKDKSGNAQTDPSAVDASNEANGAIDDAGKAADGGAAGEASKASLKAKLAGGGAAIIGIACTLHALNKGAEAVKEAQVIEPLARLGTEFVSMGSEAQDGAVVESNPDFTQQLGAVSTEYFNSNEKGNTGSWTDAQSIQGELGQKENGVAPDGVLTTITKGSALSFIDEGVVGQAVGAACGAVGTFVLNVFSFITGPATYVVGTIVFKAIEAAGVIDDVINALAGKAVNLATLAGPQFGNYVNFGAKIAGDQKFVAAGAGQLTPAQSGQINAMQQEEATDDFEQHGLAYRIFSPDTSRSLVGSLIDAQNPAVSANITQAAGGFLNFGSSIMSIPSKLFGGITHADGDGSYNYGLPNYGFSEAELTDPNLSNPYKNADFVTDPANGILESQDSSGNVTPNSSVINAASSCFGVTVSGDGSTVQAQTDGITNIYAQKYNASGCSDGSAAGVSKEDWLRVRMFIFDSETADSMSCYEGNDTACNDVGFDDNSGSSNDDGSGTDTPPDTGSTVGGDASALAKQVLADPKITLGPTAHADVVAAENNQKVTPGPIAGGGAGTGPCTARTPVYINATLLQAMLNIATKYNYEIQDITSGHNCDTGRHPLGRAMDIFQVNGKSMTWSGSNLAPDKQFATDVAGIMSQLLPKGKFVNGRPVNMAGIGVCQQNSIARPPTNVNYFVDACDELHVDVGVAP